MKRVLIIIVYFCFIFYIFAAEEKENTISLDFRDAPIEDVLRTIAKQSGYNIIMSENVKGTVTIHLEDVSPVEAIDAVTSISGLISIRKANIFKIVTPDMAEQEKTVIEVYRLKYITAVDAWQALRDISEIKQEEKEINAEGSDSSQKSDKFTISRIVYGSNFIIERVTIGLDETKNSLILFGLPNDVDNVKKIIKQIDKPTQSILIDTLMVEVGLNEGEKLGIDWNIEGTVSGASRPTTFPFTSKSQELDKYYPSVDTSSGDFPASAPFGFPYAESSAFLFGTLDFRGLVSTLHFLKTRSSTRILSHPRIVTLDGRVAKIHVGDDIPDPRFDVDPDTGRLTITGFDRKKIGVVLYVKPTIIDNGIIRLQVHPQISSKASTGGFITTGGIEVPAFTTRETDVEVNIKDGQTLAIGGLIKNNSNTTIRKVPLLGDIPLVGKLFSYTVKNDNDNSGRTELLVFVTVHILGNNKDVPFAKLDRFTRRDLRKAIKNYHVNFGNLGREEIKPKRGIKNRKSIKLNKK